MMGVEAPKTCWATHKRQVVNLWKCSIWWVDLFELYDDPRAYQRQIVTYRWRQDKETLGGWHLLPPIFCIPYAFGDTYFKSRSKRLLRLEVYIVTPTVMINLSLSYVLLQNARIVEQSAITAAYSINRLLFIIETESMYLLFETDWMFK